GSASDIKIQAEQSLLLKQQLNELQAFHSGQSVDQIAIDSDRDRWFTPSEAKDYGFIDHVVARSEERRVGKECRLECRMARYQAEDGIRDRNVTGVQTCALPIWFGIRY